MNIIITDLDHPSMEQELAVFGPAGLTYTHLNCRTEDEVIEHCKGGEIFLVQYAFFTRRVLEALKPEIKQIVRYGVGVNTIDLEAASELGVQVCNIPDYGMNEVADQAVGMMMSLVRKITYMSNYTKTQKWDYTHGMPLYRLQEQTVGIFGLGRIGKTFAKRMSGFGVRLIACDTVYNVGDVVEGAEIVDFDTLIEQSDIISIHSPFDKTTENKFNLDVFKKMKDTAYLVNVSRGGIVNEADLAVALEEKMIAGAGIDVVVDEPMGLDSPLFKFDNFLCTPHTAWYSEQSALELKRKVAEEATRFAKGEPVHYPVNKIK